MKERKKQANQRKQDGANEAKQKWLTEEQRRYINDTPQARQYLSGWDTFTPNGYTEEQLKEWANADDSRTWSPDDVVEWIVTNLPLDRANHILSIEGMQRARELFANYREYTLEDWALLKPGRWKTIEEKHQNPNCTLFDFWRTTPPDISGVTVPAMAEHWWNSYIRFKDDPQETDPQRRCAYLVVAGLLPTPFNGDDLIRLSANLIENPNPDTRYAEWNLTAEGYARLSTMKSKKKRGRKIDHNKQQRNKDIYYKRQNRATYQELMDEYGLSHSEVENAIGAHRKRLGRGLSR